MVKSKYLILFKKGYTPVNKLEIEDEIKLTLTGSCRAETNRQIKLLIAGNDNIEDYTLLSVTSARETNAIDSFTRYNETPSGFKIR